MSKATAIKMLNHWILAGRSEGLRPGTSDLAVIVGELDYADEARYIERLEKAFLKSEHGWACSRYDNPDAIALSDNYAKMKLDKIREMDI